MQLRPHPVAVIEPPNLVGKVAAPVREDDLQVRTPLEDPADDQPRGRERRLRREAHEVPQVIVPQPAHLPPVLRVEEERRAEAGRRRKHRHQAGFVQVPAVDVRADLEPAQSEFRHPALELARGPLAILHRQRAQADHPFPVSLRQSRDAIVHQPRDPFPEIRIGPVEKLAGRRSDRRRVQPPPVQPLEHQALVGQPWINFIVGLDDNIGRRVIHGEFLAGAALDLHRLPERPPPYRLEKRRRHDVEMHVDRLHGSRGRTPG